MPHRLVIVVLACLLAACTADDSPAEPVYPGRCQAPDGVDSAPRTIRSAMELLDALPKPVTVPCFVECLDRPVEVLGSSDFISAQPAAGPDAPRIFAIYDTLIISFVPDGDGSRVLEFAEERPNGLSVKAELEMPADGDLEPALPFEHILEDQSEGTVCGTCHAFEALDPSIDYAKAYASEAIRPAVSRTQTVDDIQAAAGRCDPSQTPERCAILDALFYRGDVIDGEFPRPLPTIYD